MLIRLLWEERDEERERERKGCLARERRVREVPPVCEEPLALSCCSRGDPVREVSQAIARLAGAGKPVHVNSECYEAGTLAA